MRKEYDFSKAKRNPYAKRLKRQVTIRLDHGTIAYFKALSEETGIRYQTLINLYLRDCAATRKRLAVTEPPEQKAQLDVQPFGSAGAAFNRGVDSMRASGWRSTRTPLFEWRLSSECKALRRGLSANRPLGCSAKSSDHRRMSHLAPRRARFQVSGCRCK